jgi:hypothetical protein
MAAVHNSGGSSILLAPRQHTVIGKSGRRLARRTSPWVVKYLPSAGRVSTASAPDEMARRRAHSPTIRT